MIKALFFDLDGTLLNNEKVITAATKATLKRCTAQGIKLFIVTARPPMLEHMLTWDRHSASLFSGGAFYNGGCVVIGEYKEYLPISPDMVERIIACTIAYKQVNIALQLENERHAFRFPLTAKGYEAWGLRAEDTLTIHEAVSFKVVKMLLFYNNLVDSQTTIDTDQTDALTLLCREGAQYCLTDQGRCVQIMGKAVNKYTGIERIRARMGYRQNEIAVFGDDFNDSEMLSAYEYSVCMGNAEEAVQKTARYVTLDNENDGVCHAIHHILRLFD